MFGTIGSYYVVLCFVLLESLVSFLGGGGIDTLSIIQSSESAFDYL